MVPDFRLCHKDLSLFYQGRKYESQVSRLQKEKKMNERKIKKYESEIANQKEIINKQNNTINLMKKSNSWKFTKPLRDLKKRF